jgi:hypothetical protein
MMPGAAAVEPQIFHFALADGTINRGGGGVHYGDLFVNSDLLGEIADLKVQIDDKVLSDPRDRRRHAPAL